ncbi:MAG: DUF2975 domain-containing protein [Verrucomicrobiia bacterium]|jgi:hypothetical protein
MKPESEARLKKIKRVSNVLRVICQVGMIIVTCVFIGVMALILIGRGSICFADNCSLPLAPLTVPARLVLAVVSALALAVGFKGFYHLYRLLGNYGRGDIFTSESAGQIRQLGITVLLWYGANILWAFTAVSLSPATLPFSVQFHSDSLVTGPIIIVISWFMEMAAEMREENELTI